MWSIILLVAKLCKCGWVLISRTPKGKDNCSRYLEDEILGLKLQQNTKTTFGLNIGKFEKLRFHCTQMTTFPRKVLDPVTWNWKTGIQLEYLSPGRYQLVSLPIFSFLLIGSNLITAANFCLNGKFAVVGTYDGRCIFYETEVRWVWLHLYTYSVCFHWSRVWTVILGHTRSTVDKWTHLAWKYHALYGATVA